jgi:hypothetical protein
MYMARASVAQNPDSSRCVKVELYATKFFDNVTLELEFYRESVTDDHHTAKFEGGTYNETVNNEKEEQQNINKLYKKVERQLESEMDKEIKKNYNITEQSNALALIAANTTNTDADKQRVRSLRAQLNRSKKSLTIIQDKIQHLQDLQRKYTEIATHAEILKHEFKKFASVIEELDQDYDNEDNITAFEDTEKNIRRETRALSRMRSTFEKMNKEFKDKWQPKQPKKSGAAATSKSDSDDDSDDDGDDDSDDGGMEVQDEGSHAEGEDNSAEVGQLNYNEGANCDGCEAENVKIWYHCETCTKDYDLCEDCYSNRSTRNIHPGDHTFVLETVPDSEDANSDSSSELDDEDHYVIPYDETKDSDEKHPDEMHLKIYAVDLEFLGLGNTIRLQPVNTDEEKKTYLRLGVKGDETKVRTVCIASCVYDTDAHVFRTTAYNLEQLLQASVDAPDDGDDNQDEARFQAITKQLEQDHQRDVIEPESARRKRISAFRDLISKDSTSRDASALIGYNFSNDKKNINKLRDYDINPKNQDKSWLEYPPIIDLYTILNNWCSKKGLFQQCKLKLKQVSHLNGMNRDSAIADTDGMEIYSMFLQQDWKKMAEYNEADARETLHLFLHKHIYVELKVTEQDQQPPLILKVPTHEAAMHAYKDAPNKDSIKAVLKDAVRLRDIVEAQERSNGTFYEIPDDDPRLYTAAPANTSPAKSANKESRSKKKK